MGIVRQLFQRHLAAGRALEQLRMIVHHRLDIHCLGLGVCWRLKAEAVRHFRSARR
jgi:hypothetical protein